MAVADDEGDRHGFPQRAPQTQHHRADRAAADIGQHDLVDHLIGRATHAIGRLAHMGGHREQQFAQDRGDIGQHHHRQNHRGGKDIGPIGDAFEQMAPETVGIDHIEQRQLHMQRKPRRQHEQPPHARASPDGQTSTRNTAIPTASGIAITMASPAVTSVPTIGPAAPQSPAPGSHAAETKNFGPKTPSATYPPTPDPSPGITEPQAPP
ncbi:hypothetical protein E4T56_gene9625, partial [Termitomyces sp. T112]